MDLEGNLLLERAPTRRWVSIVAVIVPVVATVMLTTWFIRAYIAPATILIPNAMTLASAPYVPHAVAKAEAPPPPAAEPARPAAVTAPAAVAWPNPPAAEQPATQPTFATLTATPQPDLQSPPAAFADPAQDAASVAPAEAAVEPSQPILGPVPLPRTKPHVSLALVTGVVPLPHPRPTEESTPPPATDLPAFDRHAIE